LAYDPQIGRLWEVCSGCGRWNLTPLEDRWETLEACERAVHDRGVERLRTPHLSLLDVKDGELIRVGDPARGEFVDWRYGPRLFSSFKKVGFLTRILSRLPPPPAAGYDPYRRGFTMEDDTPWFASPFLESASALSYLFSQIPLAPACPACDRPLGLKPWDFQRLRILSESGRVGILSPCGFCAEEVVIDLRDARPTLRLALGLVTAPTILRGVAHPAAGGLDQAGGVSEFLSLLSHDDLSLGEMSLPARASLLIALDEGAEAEALEAEWRESEEMAAISDGELSPIPGFEAFRNEILEEDL